MTILKDKTVGRRRVIRWYDETNRQINAEYFRVGTHQIKSVHFQSSIMVDRNAKGRLFKVGEPEWIGKTFVRWLAQCIQGESK